MSYFQETLKLLFIFVPVKIFHFLTIVSGTTTFIFWPRPRRGKCSQDWQKLLLRKEKRSSEGSMDCQQGPMLFLWWHKVYWLVIHYWEKYTCMQHGM